MKHFLLDHLLAITISVALAVLLLDFFSILTAIKAMVATLSWHP